jgi:hypothetical protein
MAVQPYSLSDENTPTCETALRVFRASLDRLRGKAKSLSDHITRGAVIMKIDTKTGKSLEMAAYYGQWRRMAARPGIAVIRDMTNRCASTAGKFSLVSSNHANLN